MRGRLIGPKTWDRVVRIVLGFLRGRDCPENKWAVRVFNSGNFALKCMLDMRKCRKWAVDRSQNMGLNYGKFFGHLGQSVKPRN